MTLASYACRPEDSLGRFYPEAEDPNRSCYQRDRDRIIHATAFRRLEYKTQVFVNHEGDLFRTRLTHSIEVSQIARSLARRMEVDVDLCESVALAHDLGHTPFGHAGQDALNAVIREMDPELGGFEHNIQSLRVVDVLEERYAEFPGLNLSFETRAGILKHCSERNARRLGDVAARFLNDERPSLEAQLVNRADEIAYNNHDIDDGLRSGLIHVEQLREIELFALYHDEVMWRYPELSDRRIITETIRRIINALLNDLVEETQSRISEFGVVSPEDVRYAPYLVQFSPEVHEQNQALKSFLLHNLYRHYKVMRMSVKAERIIRDLYQAFRDEPRLMPADYQSPDPLEQAQNISDYIAGMTDRYAIKEHQRIFAVTHEPFM